MNTVDLSQIKAVAFDIDGTLYRSWRFFLRMTPHFLVHMYFFAQYGLARKALRRNAITEDFDNAQVAEMAKRLHCTPEEAKALLDKIVYKGLCKYFEKIPPCSGVVNFISDLKNKGYKIGILSDFPPEQKGNIWGIKALCDVCLGAEKAGALKPSPIPFKKLAELFGLKPEEILYVGNSHKYDVVGASTAGMKTAWIKTNTSKLFGKKSDIADITFVHYNELHKIIENSTVQKP